MVIIYLKLQYNNYIPVGIVTSALFVHTSAKVFVNSWANGVSTDITENSLLIYNEIEGHKKWVILLL